MPFFADDLFWRLSEINIELVFGQIVTPVLRLVCMGYPPFDMIWMTDTITGFAQESQGAENIDKVNMAIKENRLLYELGDITEEEYEAAENALDRERKWWRKRDSTRARTLLEEE